MAMRCARNTFFTVIGKKAPALVVASLAMIITSKPAIRPMPVTIPAQGTSSTPGYPMPKPANRESSKNGVSGSMISVSIISARNWNWMTTLPFFTASHCSIWFRMRLKKSATQQSWG